MPQTPYVPGGQGVGVVEVSDTYAVGSRVWFFTPAGMKPGDGALAVSGLPAAQIGAAAAAAGITVLELATEQASLEDAFVDLTQDAVEFRAAARPAAGPALEEEK